MKKEISLHVRFWVNVGGSPFLGIGKIVLLEKIAETGSISKAAESMNMSYRKAWQMIKEMNALSTYPLVIKKQGGANGGGAELTEEGRKILNDYFLLLDDTTAFLKERARQYDFLNS